MSTPTEIREWAKEHDIVVSERGRISADVIAEYEAAHPVTGDDGETALVIELPSEMPPAGGGDESPAAASPQVPRRPEIPPQGKKRTWRDKRKAADEGGKSPAGKRKPRASLETLASWAWSLGGMAATQFPQATPVGRMLMMQSPVAGVIVDDLARGTVVDRILQPFARSGEKAEKAFALMGPPVLVGIISANPELGQALIPALKVALLSWAEIAGPAFEKAQKKAEQLAERTGGVDVDAMIEALFTMPEQMSADEEAAIRRAQANGHG